MRHAARPVAEGGKKLAVNLWVLERPFEVYRTSLKSEDGAAVPRRGQLRDHPVAGASVHYLDGRWKATNDASGVTHVLGSAVVCVGVRSSEAACT